MTNIFDNASNIEIDNNEVVKIKIDNEIVYEKQSLDNSYLELSFTGTTLTQNQWANSPIIGENIIIDYGDGTVVDSDGNFGHTYNESGTYNIKIYNATSLGSDCFFNCTGLTSVTIPNNITSLGRNCFYGSGLTSVVIPDNVTSLGQSCFKNCSDLTSVIILNDEISIGSNCFEGCISLSSVTLPNLVNSDDSWFYNCSSLTSISFIPNTITSFPISFFAGCTGLTSVTIPNNITSLGGSCFARCTGLTSVIIPNTITSLPYACFSRTGLISINIPDTVSSISSYCFEQCPNLTNMILNWNSSDDIITYNSDWMSNVDSNFKFSIPYGTMSLYEAKNYPSNKLVERNENE